METPMLQQEPDRWFVTLLPVVRCHLILKVVDYDNVATSPFLVEDVTTHGTTLPGSQRGGGAHRVRVAGGWRVSHEKGRRQNDTHTSCR